MRVCVVIMGQYLQAGLMGEVHLAISTILLGPGENLFMGLDLRALGDRRTAHMHSTNATHAVFTKRAI